MKKLLIFIFWVVFSVCFAQKQQGQTCPEDLFPYLDKETKLFGYVNLAGEWLVPANYLKAYPFVGNKAIVQKGTKLGIINCKGYLVVDAQYEDFKPFNFDKVWVRQNGLWGLVTDQGQLMVRPTFNEVLKICNECDQVWVKKQDKWALFSEKTNKMLVLPTFNSVRPLSETASLVELNDSIGVVENKTGKFMMKANLLKVQKVNQHYLFKTKESKWGVMEQHGNITVEPVYDTVFAGENNLLVAKKGKKWGLIGYKSQVYLKFVFDNIEPFSEGQAVCVFDGKYGLINRSGKLFFNPQFDFVGDFVEGCSVAKRNGKYGLIDKGGNPKVDFIYDGFFEYKAHGYVRFLKEKKYELIKRKEGLVLFSGATKMDTLVAFDKIRLSNEEGVFYVNLLDGEKQPKMSFQDGKTAEKNSLIVKKEGKWGVVASVDGKIIVNFEHDSVSMQSVDGSICFLNWKGKKIGVLDHNGATILAPGFDFVSVEENKTFKVIKNGTFGIMNSKGSTVADFKYTKMSNLTENPNWPSYPAVFERGKKTGLINFSGQETVVSSGMWTYVGGQLFANFKDGKYEIYKSNGLVFSAEKFDSLKVFAGNLVPAKKNNAWGFLAMGGKWAIQPQFEEVFDFANNQAVVKKNGLFGVINSQGKWIHQPEFEGYHHQEKTLTKTKKKYKITENGILKPLL